MAEEDTSTRAPELDDRDITKLIYDWNSKRYRGPVILNREFELHDETLRDGIQNPSVVDPDISDKLEILHMLEAIGVDTIDVGLPGAGPRAFEDVLRLCKEIADQKIRTRTIKSHFGHGQAVHQHHVAVVLTIRIADGHEYLLKELFCAIARLKDAQGMSEIVVGEEGIVVGFKKRMHLFRIDGFHFPARRIVAKNLDKGCSYQGNAIGTVFDAAEHGHVGKVRPHLKGTKLRGKRIQAITPGGEPALKSLP